MLNGLGAKGMGATAGIAGGQGMRYEVEAVAFFSRLTTPPTDERKEAINAVYSSLKSGGILPKLDILWLIGADTQASTRNWAQAAFDLTAVNAPTFNADRYFASNGTSSYLETGFNLASAAGRKYSQNSASMGVWCTTNLASGTVDCGTTNSIILPRSASDVLLARQNAASNTSLSGVLSSIGMTQVSRTGPSLERIRAPSGVITSGLAPSQAPDNLSPRFLGRSGLVQYAPHPQAGGYIGAGMTDDDMDLIAEVFMTYLTEIGAYTP